MPAGTERVLEKTKDPHPGFSAPVIQEPILRDEARLPGRFTPEEAHDLAPVLREGALPAPVRIIEKLTK